MCATNKKRVVEVIISAPQRIPVHYIHKRTKNIKKIEKQMSHIKLSTHVCVCVCVCLRETNIVSYSHKHKHTQRHFKRSFSRRYVHVTLFIIIKSFKDLDLNRNLYLFLSFVRYGCKYFLEHLLKELVLMSHYNFQSH